MTADLSRAERLAWAMCEQFHARYGTDADRPSGDHWRWAIWSFTECPARIRIEPFEEILNNFEEIARLESDEVAVWDHDREVWPNDSDYCTVRNQEVQTIRDTITAQIRALLA